jgi:hypothetical protein
VFPREPRKGTSTMERGFQPVGMRQAGIRGASRRMEDVRAPEPGIRDEIS